jgi:hypothetical protein
MHTTMRSLALAEVVVYHCRGLGSILGHSMCDLWWKSATGTFFSEYFECPQSLLSHQVSKFIDI